MKNIQSAKKRILYAFSWLTLSSSMVLMLLITFWLVYPYKIAEFETPFEIVNPVVKRGDRVRYVIKYCKWVDVSPMITKFFVDGVIFETPKSQSIIPVGCGEIISDAYVPKALPAGTYTIKTVAEYKVNPIRTIKIINHTKSFVVQ